MLVEFVETIGSESWMGNPYFAEYIVSPVRLLTPVFLCIFFSFFLFFFSFHEEEKEGINRPLPLV